MSADLVTCHCGTSTDRTLYTQCPRCGTDLWDLTADSESESEPHPQVTHSPRTVIDTPQRTSCSGRVVIDGQILTVAVGGVLLIGRDDMYPEAATFARYPNVSRRHGLLRFDGVAFHITDTGSANGTFVGDVRIPADTEYEIRPGQPIRLAADVTLDLLIA